MTKGIPPRVISYIKGIFANSNRIVARAMDSNPHLREEYLDQLFLSSLIGLNRIAIKVPKTSWIIRIDTHFLGSRWMWDRWEVADIGLLLTFRQGGQVRRSKVGLLQSKRLYATEINEPTSEIDINPIGFGSLFISDAEFSEESTDRNFTFTPESKYLQLKYNDHQYKAIRDYERYNRIPIYYLFYNPSELPITVTIPAENKSTRKLNVGCRVISADDVRGVMNQTKNSPSYQELDLDRPHLKIQDFIEDLLLCKKGHIISLPSDEAVQRLFYQRNAPISAAISISIDGPEGLEFTETNEAY